MTEKPTQEKTSIQSSVPISQFDLPIYDRDVVTEEAWALEENRKSRQLLLEQIAITPTTDLEKLERLNRRLEGIESSINTGESIIRRALHDRNIL